MSLTETIAAKTFICNGCGTPLKIPLNKMVVQCPSCKNDCLIEKISKNLEIAAKEHINSGIPLTATPEELHKTILNCLYSSAYLPLDIHDNIVVLREEHYCVPAFCFECDGTASFRFEQGVERKETYSEKSGDSYVTKTRTHIDWHPVSNFASATETLFTSGNRDFVYQIYQLYSNISPSMLVDIEDLDFPLDIETSVFNVPQASAFNEHIKPIMEELLEKQAYNSMQATSGRVRNFSVIGCKVQKEMTRVFLGLYCLVYKYHDGEYMIWATGDGKKTLFDRLPYDAQREHTHVEKKQHLSSIPSNKTGWMVFGLIAFLIGAGAAYYNQVDIGHVIMLGIVALIFGIFLPFVAKKGKEYDYQRANSKDDLRNFESELPAKIQQFKDRKVALKGIYEGVSGDSSAF